MLKRSPRRLAWVILASFLLLALIPGVGLLHSLGSSGAHANTIGRMVHHPHLPHLLKKLRNIDTSSPVLSTSTATVHPYQQITVTGQNFQAGETIRLQLDNNSSVVIQSIPCDSNGTCTGSVTMPGTSEVNGLHPLIATGLTSGLSAQAPLTFVPILTASPNRGGPGSYTAITGNAFAADENVSIYWGTQSPVLETTVTADANGNFSTAFYTPTGVPAGSYSIIAVRAFQNPARVGIHFTVLPPKMTSTAGIRNGQSVQVHLTGFQPYEYVSISWNANGGQQVGTVTTTYDGSGVGSFTPPSASRGSYTLTALGETSGLSATSSLSIGAAISLTPSSAGAGSTITVNGGGFLSGETVKVYFQTTSNGVVSATVNADGTFSASLTVPVVYKQGVSYYVYANGPVSSEHTKALFTYIAPSFYSYYYPGACAQDSVSGSGFVANEKVNVYWSYGQPGQVLAGTLTADSQGNIYTNTLTVPSVPQGYVTIAAVGTTSFLTATSAVYEYADVVLSPTSGPQGTSLKVAACGFNSQESVTVSFAGTTVATGTTDTTGAFASTITVPAVAIGNYAVTATGSSSGLSESTYFTVVPSLALSQSGTTVTVNGSNFSASGSVYLYWYDPSYTYISTVTADATGAFQTTFTATGLVSGNTYTVCGYDYTSGLTGCSTFVAS